MLFLSSFFIQRKKGQTLKAEKYLTALMGQKELGRLFIYSHCAIQKLPCHINLLKKTKGVFI